MRPWLVVAAQVDGMPLASVWAVPQVLPPLLEEMKPTLKLVLPDG